MKTAVPKVPRRHSGLNALLEPFFCPPLKGQETFGTLLALG
jgi:hypothetical protein